jgi:nucleotide-binding universal stress UspA family protein
MMTIRPYASMVIAMPVARRPVVVGVDGTDQSVPALRWAAFEALQRDTELVAVHAFGSPWQSAPYAPAHISLSPDGAAGQAVALLDRCLGEAFGDRPPVPVRKVCDSRRPVPALLDHGKSAALLVLSARPDPARGGATLGPIARDCLRNAPCPVVLLPTTADIPATSRAGVDTRQLTRR